MADYYKSIVAPSVLQAGLPVTSLQAFITALAGGDTADIEAIPGVTPTILEVAAASMRTTYSKAFKIVFLVCLAFCGVAVISSYWAPNVEERLNHDVVRRLDGSGLTSSDAEIDHEKGQKREL